MKKLLFELNNVEFAYPFEKPILESITLKVTQGEKIGLLGVNGCGKSTLLKMMAGLIYPSKGEIRAFDDTVTEKSFNDDTYSKNYHRRVGFIFQDSDVQLFCSTVEDEIAFGPLQMGHSQDVVRGKIEDIMNKLGILHLKDKTPFKLSGGEKKKVALAAVLVMDPEVLILDEPTNGLDPKTQRWLVEWLNTLNKAGCTLITSTHNLELVQEMSDRAILMAAGEGIVADMPMAELFQDIELLKRVNLVDDYYHRHDDGKHCHFHVHTY